MAFALYNLSKTDVDPEVEKLLLKLKSANIDSKFSDLKNILSSKNVKFTDVELINNLDFLKKDIAEKEYKIVRRQIVGFGYHFLYFTLKHSRMNVRATTIAEKNERIFFFCHR